MLFISLLPLKNSAIIGDKEGPHQPSAQKGLRPLPWRCAHAEKRRTRTTVAVPPPALGQGCQKGRRGWRHRKLT